MVCRRALRAIIALLVAALVLPASARAADVAVTIPFEDLGYRDAITVEGVAPSFTFDLPRYASLQSATLQLELHVAPAADADSTIEVIVNGRPAYRRALRDIGEDPLIAIALPLPPAAVGFLAVTVRGHLRIAGDPCAPIPRGTLFMTIGRDSALLVRAAAGGDAAAFFRDYRGAIDLVSAHAGPDVAGVPYRINRLEPWHRVVVTPVSAARPGRRTIVLRPGAPTERRGDVLRISPAAFAALPAAPAPATERRAGSVSFVDLGRHVRTATGLGDLAFDVPLAGSVVGGVPRRLRVHVVLAHTALAARVSGTLQVLVNGTLVAARELARGATTEMLSATAPDDIVGPTNDVRVIASTTAPAGSCAAGVPVITATVLGTSSFTWDGVVRRAPSIESFLTLLNGRVVVAVDPALTTAAVHFMGEVGRMNAGISQLDVVPFRGAVPPGYDYAIVFAPPQAIAHLALPVRTVAPVFDVVNPVDGVTARAAGPGSTFALLQLGESAGTPVLAVSYHGDAGATRWIASVAAAQLATQIGGLTIVDAGGATTYDVGEKLRVSYPDDRTPGRIWHGVRLPVTLALFALLVLAGSYCARRLTGRTIS